MTKSIKKHAQDTDQYFTKKDIAVQCIKEAEHIISVLKWKKENTLWVEPSAGNGSFSDILLKENKYVWAGDLHPKKTYIHKLDYIEDTINFKENLYLSTFEHIIIIGNPPFGKKAKLAINFINKGLTQSQIVAFILPIQLKKWLSQKQINKEARLIFNKDLPEDSFLFLNKTYKLRCCFQIWTTKSYTELPYKNLRILNAPQTKHEDFEAWQYNCTKEALKYFDYPWDFAVLRQGYGDFNTLYLPKDKNNLSTKKQWIFIKAHNKKSLDILKSIDYKKLSLKNTGTPGFGKANLVEAYINKKL